MGQYYDAIIKMDNVKEVYSTYVDGKYMLAKLMEHSYWNNSYVLAIASKFWRMKGRLAWVGDYANAEDFNWNDEFSDAHNEKIEKEDLVYNGFRLEGKYFINYDKKEFVDFDKYKELLKDVDMIINPIPLLTVVGNRKGGGDYYVDVCADMVGVWTWDMVEITDYDVYEWSYNYGTNNYEKKLKHEFIKFRDITEECLFNEEF